MKKYSVKNKPLKSFLILMFSFSSYKKVGVPIMLPKERSIIYETVCCNKDFFDCFIILFKDIKDINIMGYKGHKYHAYQKLA